MVLGFAHNKGEAIVMRKNIKKNNKGFTLVEVVVVLVILAILAAVAVPALTGYIKDSKERAALLGAKHFRDAAQSYLTLNAEALMSELETMQTTNVGTTHFNVNNNSFAGIKTRYAAFKDEGLNELKRLVGDDTVNGQEIDNIGFVLKEGTGLNGVYPEAIGFQLKLKGNEHIIYITYNLERNTSVGGKGVWQHKEGNDWQLYDKDYKLIK